MLKHIAVNIKANLKLFKRTGFAISMGLIFLAYLVLMFIFQIQIGTISGLEKFDIIKNFSSQFSSLSMFFSAALALIVLATPLKNRSAKMVFTKPCPPELWVLSGYLSVFLVLFILQLFCLMVSVVLFFLWNVPFQWGVFFVFFYRLFRSMLVVSYIIILSVCVSQPEAVFLVLFFNSWNFYFFTKVVSYKLILREIFYFIYMILPVYSPFKDKIGSVFSSYNFTSSDLKYLLFTFVYTFVFFVFSWLLTIAIIKRKKHIL